MFASRAQRHGVSGVVDVGFTDRHGGVSPPPCDSLDLAGGAAGALGARSFRAAASERNFALLAREFNVAGFVTMRQVHGAEVAVVGPRNQAGSVADALVTSAADVALCVRVGDCVPVVLADADRGVVGVVHAGRPGVVAGVVAAAVRTMRSSGAQDIEAWVGPHVCGGCYEVPTALRAEVAAAAPAGFACTTWGTPAVDIGAAVRAQLGLCGCVVNDLAVCTLESDDLYSYRRDGSGSGRSAGVVVLRGQPRD
ncbi:MAG: laccase domain-containing protein [Nocardioidaceae bacterium]